MVRQLDQVIVLGPFHSYYYNHYQQQGEQHVALCEVCLDSLATGTILLCITLRSLAQATLHGPLIQLVLPSITVTFLKRFSA